MERKQQQSGPLATIHNFTEAQQEQLRELVRVEEERLRTTLRRVEAYAYAEFNSRKQKLDALVESFRASKTSVTPQMINTATLPFSDKVRHLREKLNTVMDYKQIIMNSQNELSKKCYLSAEQQVEATNNFDLICNYAKRRQENIRGKSLYTLPVCKHLIRRTFKKTAVGVYDLLASYQVNWIPEGREKLKIASIGGGPASDLTGALVYLLSQNYSQFECHIFDYNHDRWSIAASDLSQIMTKEAKKLNKSMKLDMKWQPFDMDPQSQHHTALSKISGYDVLTCCWALNEDVYSESMWQTLLQNNKQCIFVLIDGDRYPIEYVWMTAKDCKRVCHYCSYSSPRTLIILPESP